MTDTTDIKALREAMLTKGKSSLTAKEVVTIISELDRLNDTVKHLRIEVSASDAAFLEMKKQYSTQFDRCRELAGHLEAERQRADELTLAAHRKMSDEIIAELDAEDLKGDQVPVALTVWYGSMPESNGKENWTAILHRKGEGKLDGITIDRSEYPERVLYAADRARYLIGEKQDRPHILSYDSDKRSNYIYQVTAPQKPVVRFTPPINPVMFNADVMFGYNKARAEDKAAIEAAGGTVKDGE